MGSRRNIVCITLVLGIIIFGSVFEDNILPSVEAPSTTLEITAVAIDGSDTFNYTVTGPASYNTSIPTIESGTFTGEIAVYHTFDTTEIDQSNTLQNLYVNSGTFGHNADAHGLSNRFHSSIESDDGILGDSIFVDNSQNQDIILGNWINLDQWNFLADDKTQKYSINFWVKGNFNSLGVGNGVPILSAMSMQSSQDATEFGFDLWVNEFRQPSVSIWNNLSPVINLQGNNIQDNNWQMITFIIDKRQGINTATIWINASTPVSTDISGSFQPITGSYIDQPLLIGDSNAPSNRVDYNATTVDFSIDDLCIIKDYEFTQADVDTLYSDGEGNTCADITDDGVSTTDIPILSYFDELNGINSITLPQQISSDFVIGNIIDIPIDATVTKLRLYFETSDVTSGILQAVILSNITEGVTMAGDEIIEAASDSIDFSNPQFQASNFFVTFNFTGADVDLSNGNILVGIKGTSIVGGSALVFNAFNGNVGNGGESLCIDLTNATSSYSNCNDSYLPQNFFAQNLMYEVNIEGNGTTNGVGISNREIDNINFANSGSFGIDGPNLVDPGLYFIQETIPAGWNVTDAFCNDDSSSFSGDTVSDISIDSGDSIECTFTNELVPPGTLKITKLTTGGDDTFDYAVSGPTSYNPSIITTGGIGIDGPNPVDPGTYSIQETIQSGWSLTTATCNDGSSSFSVDTVSGIVVGSGDDIECTFTNELVPPGTLKITKLTTGGDDTFDYTVSGPTSLTPSITTSGGSVSMTATNSGTLGASADAFYEEDELDTSFNIDNTGLIGKSVLQEGMSSLHDNGTIRFGSDADKDQWKFIWDSTVPVISMNFWLKGDIDGNPEYQILSTSPDDSGLFNLFRMYSQTTGSGGSEPEIIYIIKDDAFSSALQGIFVDHIPADDGQWHMMTFLIDKNNATNAATLCIDATDCKTSGTNGLVGSAGSPHSALRYGFDKVIDTNNDFQLDDFTIWTGYQLTSSDIASLYNSGSGTSAGASGASISLANQVGHWTFDTLLNGTSGIGIDGPNPVDPGTYSIQETIQSGWSLTTATCNDGSSSFSVDIVSGIVVGSGANIECTFENEFMGSADTDVDGIFDEVDTLPNTISDDFSDIALGGTSLGTITTRGNQTLTITEEPNPNGLRIAADISGGLVPAVVNACGGFSLITLSPGDEIVVTCSSVTVNLINGQVEILFIGIDNTEASVILPQGNTITFDPNFFSFVVPPENTEPLIILVNGTEITINPGSAILTAESDSFLKSGNKNTNEGANEVLSIQSTGSHRSLVTFNQTAIEKAVADLSVLNATLRLYIEDNANNWSSNGRTIDVHRLSADWTQGNGWNTGNNIRGTGSGITWNCAIDTNINNQQPNCSPQWNGGTFVPTTTDSILITNGLEGQFIEFDVTADVQAFLDVTANYGWIIKKTQEGQNGSIDLTSHEGSANNPELVIFFN
ncbi:MAG: DNRLRE domain-containing protein [Nitrososphaerales archaeon]